MLYQLWYYQLFWLKSTTATYELDIIEATSEGRTLILFAGLTW
jgi:hypothetical protein